MDESPLLAITVQQPWAWAIMHGGKGVENRTRIGTWRKLAGQTIAIHAGGRLSDRGVQAVPTMCTMPSSAWWQHLVTRMPMGAVLGTVDVVDVHLEEGGCCSPWGEQSYVEAGGTKRTEIVHIVIENPRPLAEPEPCKGMLGPWTLPDHIAQLIAAEQATP